MIKRIIINRKLVFFQQGKTNLTNYNYVWNYKLSTYIYEKHVLSIHYVMI